MGSGVRWGGVGVGWGWGGTPPGHPVHRQIPRSGIFRREKIMPWQLVISVSHAGHGMFFSARPAGPGHGMIFCRRLGWQPWHDFSPALFFARCWLQPPGCSARLEEIIWNTYGAGLALRPWHVFSLASPGGLSHGMIFFREASWAEPWHDFYFARVSQTRPWPPGGTHFSFPAMGCPLACPSV